MSECVVSNVGTSNSSRNVIILSITDQGEKMKIRKTEIRSLDSYI